MSKLQSVRSSPKLKNVSSKVLFDEKLADVDMDMEIDTPELVVNEVSIDPIEKVTARCGYLT